MENQTQMNRAMLSIIKKHRKDYTQKLIEEIGKGIYRYERYGVHFSVAIGCALPVVNLENFSNMIRQTDSFLILEENLCVVIFEGAEHSGGLKAASNMLSQFEKFHFSDQLYLSFIDGSEFEDTERLVNKLINKLEHALKDELHNVLLDANDDDFNRKSYL